MPPPGKEIWPACLRSRVGAPRHQHGRRVAGDNRDQHSGGARPEPLRRMEFGIEDRARFLRRIDRQQPVPRPGEHLVGPESIVLHDIHHALPAVAALPMTKN